MMIEVENLSKTYISSRDKSEALKDIRFQSTEGEILGVLGPNGAGKSTLIKVLSTVLTRDKGRIVMDGCSIDDSSKYREKFTVTMQSSSLELWLTVEDNLKIYGKFFGLNKKLLTQRIDEVIEIFELSEYKRKRAAELSGGYKKRLQLAKNFLVDTPVMMLDEPTVGLDPNAKNNVIQLLRKKSLEGKTIIFTTQVIAEAEELCSKVMILNKGSMAVADNLTGLKNKFNHKKRIAFKFNDIKDQIFNEAKFICSIRGRGNPDKYEDGILFDLSLENELDKVLIYELIDKLRPESINTKAPTLEEIFIEIVGGK
ncbi:ABC transporter ATP-binding protein [Clostridium polynesiense]|uniref:ABC transporter ATP-binding protein n=1 Tax=Clostridium polynesiense TaxID=1325933 RepID=UPI00058CDA36|nr:ABC transporter ATP-binding protein [Clostridium polynesiense]